MKFRKEGHLLIDHRASPGITQEQMVAIGQDPYMAVPEGSVLELRTMTCAHCNTPVVLNPERMRVRGHCRKCDRYVCDLCSGSECTPAEKVFTYLQEQAFRKEAGYSPLPMLTAVSPLLKGNHDD